MSDNTTYGAVGRQVNRTESQVAQTHCREVVVPPVRVEAVGSARAMGLAAGVEVAGDGEGGEGSTGRNWAVVGS